MFQLSIRVVAVALVVFSVSVHSAELEAPLGLQWGQTQEQLEAKGVNFNCQSTREGEFEIFCTTTNPPKPLSFAEHYQLFFNQGLQRVKILVAAIEGAYLEKSFDDLKQRLIAKYGKPNGWDQMWNVGWRFGDAGIALTIKNSFPWKGAEPEFNIQIHYVSKDALRLFDEAEARQTAEDDAGL